MVEINSWVDELLGKVQKAFQKRLLFFGLQGSYRRGEATRSSDIDIVVILDSLSIADLQVYKGIIATMAHSEKACGFISGRQELFAWPKYELFQMQKETKAYFGSLDELLPQVDRKDIVDSAKIGASALYHAACHTFMYGPQEEHAAVLKGLYKGCFFILQVTEYLRSGHYAQSKTQLLPLLAGPEKEILAIGMDWGAYQEDCTAKPQDYYEKIICWSSSVLQEQF